MEQPVFSLASYYGERKLAWKRICNITYQQSSYNQPTSLPTQSYLCSVYRWNSLLVSCHPSSTIRIFLITNHQPLFHICITLPVESAPFFIQSTSLCSVFTLLLAHLILRISPHHSHHLHSHHLSLPLLSTPDLKLISFTNPFRHSHSYSFRGDVTDLNLY